MKKISVLIAICLIALAQIASAQLNPDLISANTSAGMERPTIDPAGPIHEQFLIFDDTDGAGDSGIYNPTDFFGLDMYLTYEGYTSPGFSLFFHTTTNAAPNIFLTGRTLGTTFYEGNPFVSFPLAFTLPEPGGFYTNPGVNDVGGIAPPGGYAGPGTYFVGHLSVSLNGLAPGVYILQSDTILGHASEVTSFDGTNFDDNYLPAATYTITIVPEPSTLALLAITAISSGAWLCHRAFSKESRS